MFNSYVIFLTQCLHVFIKVLAVNQFPGSAESINHFCSSHRSVSLSSLCSKSWSRRNINTVWEGGDAWKSWLDVSCLFAGLWLVIVKCAASTHGWRMRIGPWVRDIRWINSEVWRSLLSWKIWWSTFKCHKRRPRCLIPFLNSNNILKVFFNYPHKSTYSFNINIYILH